MMPRVFLASRGDGGKQARSPGRARISRKAIAQGRPECLRFTCMLVCALFVHQCTRDRGCSAHPVFPAPSSVEAHTFFASLGRNRAARTRRCAWRILRDAAKRPLLKMRSTSGPHGEERGNAARLEPWRHNETLLNVRAFCDHSAAHLTLTALAFHDCTHHYCP